MRLECTQPFDWGRLLTFFAGRATPGVEVVVDQTYRRTLSIDNDVFILTVSSTPGSNAIKITTSGSNRDIPSPLRPLTRQVFDTDAPIAEIRRELSGDTTLARFLDTHPGVRVPGAWDGYELTIRAILGQQISVKAATTIAGRIANRYGKKLPREFDTSGSGLNRLFPEPEKLARARFNNLGLVQSRIDTIRRISSRVAANEICFDGSQEPGELKAALLDTKGIGPWTAEYVSMRALKDPDAFPGSDLGLLSAIAAPARVTPKELEARAEHWRPWRAYAAMLLWGSLPGAGG